MTVKKCSVSSIWWCS